MGKEAFIKRKELLKGGLNRSRKEWLKISQENNG